MVKTWSFNTTIRNPERMENMLRALAELEGRNFDQDGQEAFFGLQIKKRLYKPERRTLGEQDLIDAVYAEDTADDLEDGIVQRILDKYRGDVDAAGRGRTAAGVLNRFGLCAALQSKGAVVITDLAKKWLKHEISDEELFTKFFLKWQYPNEIEAGYGDYNIRPFVGTLKLISLVNKKWAERGKTPVGLSKLEFQLFAPALIKEDQIEDYANRIIAFRTEKESKSGKDKTDFINEYSIARAQEIFGAGKKIETALGDLKDYTDSSLRYFRVSGLIALRGGDTHIDIAKDKEVEVRAIIENIPATARGFASYEEYFDYLNNTEAVPLPWQNEGDLVQITENLSEVLKQEAGEENVAEYLSKIQSLTSSGKVESLEAKLNEVRIKKLKDLRYNIDALNECIGRLETIMSRGYETLTARPSLDFEWYTSRALMVLNDATDIAPSYTIGDDGIPIGFRSNISDIECYYESFGMTVETTLLLGRDQWYAEGQPVMRHHRDFEERSGFEKTFCIFVAPFVHRDTLNTFWGSNTAGYEGKRQIIIPLSLEQFVAVLKIARDKIASGGLSHTELLSLLQNFADKIADFNNPSDWITAFPGLIEAWA
ncbi:MAG: AlwI family type II restriction endonuclease [Candidatus Yanofskybacteria bacterium]|nr:AlwI family type II restriction endonuclease [Candidatus Yanofskybacteria bacterium]